MKLKITKKNLRTLCSRVQGALSEKSTGGIGLRAAEQGLQLFAIDSSLAIYAQAEAEVATEGTLFVSARLFGELVRELADEEVHIEHKGAWLLVETKGSASFAMKLPLKEDLSWRTPGDYSNETFASVPAAKLGYMIEQVQFCISQDPLRNYAAVAYLHKVGADKLRMVGTDAFRLSYCEIETTLPESFLEGTGACISKKALGEIFKMCNEGFENIELAVSENAGTFVARVPGYSIYTRLSNVRYPEYQGVLPKYSAESVVLSRPQIQSTVRRVLLAADRAKALQLRFSPDDLTLASYTAGASEGRESLPITDYGGQDCQLAVNGKYFTEIFSAASSENMKLQFKNSTEPIVIAATDEPSGCLTKHVLVAIKDSEFGMNHGGN